MNPGDEAPAFGTILDSSGNPVPKSFDKAKWIQNQALNSSYCLRPKKGWVPNPILAYPRNRPCPCDSGFNFKKCCLPAMPRLIPVEELADHQQVMKECRDKTKV
jgi:uncharacterized protein YecA (UPF0149 family)